MNDCSGCKWYQYEGGIDWDLCNYEIIPIKIDKHKEPCHHYEPKEEKKSCEHEWVMNEHVEHVCCRCGKRKEEKSCEHEWCEHDGYYQASSRTNVTGHKWCLKCGLTRLGKKKWDIEKPKLPDKITELPCPTFSVIPGRQSLVAVINSILDYLEARG